MPNSIKHFSIKHLDEYILQIVWRRKQILNNIWTSMQLQYVHNDKHKMQRFKDFVDKELWV